MANPLLDILPAGREVPVGRGKVTVVPVALSFIGKVIARFPDLRAQIMKGDASLSAAFMVVPESIPMVLAAGIGKAGDAETEDIMGRLGAADQLALLNEVLIETKGVDTARPLLASVKAVTVTLGIKPEAIDRFLAAIEKIDMAETVEASQNSSTTSH